jgi:hypothetical protein
MEILLRTLKVRLVADITDYSGPMTAAQAQAAALKAQLQTMFAGLGGMSAASVAQLTSPITQAAQKIGALQNTLGQAYRSIGHDAAVAQSKITSMAAAQTRMFQEAAAAANAMRALPPPPSPVVAGPQPHTPLPQAPMVSGPATASAAATMSAASAMGASRTREMFPIGDSYEAQNPIWRMRQKGLEDAAYAAGPGSKAWDDYNNARLAGGLKPAVWHDAGKYLNDPAAAGSINQQMQRMQDDAAASAAVPTRAIDAPLPPRPSAADLATAQRQFAEADLAATAQRRLKAEADARHRDLSRRLEQAKHDAATYRPRGLKAAFDGDGLGLLDPLKPNKQLYADARRRAASLQRQLNSASAAKESVDAAWNEAEENARRSKASLAELEKAEKTHEAARARRTDLAGRQLAIEDQRRTKAEAEHQKTVGHHAEDERQRVRAAHDEERRIRDIDHARATAAAHEAERLAANEARARGIGGGGGGRIPPGAGLLAGAAAAGGGGGDGLPATMKQIADDAERTAGAFDQTRAAWRDMVQMSGGVSRAVGNLFTGAGQGLTRRGNNLVQSGTKWSTRFSLPIGIAGGLMLNKGSEFESAMSEVGVYAREAGASADQIRKLSDRARELGRNTEFSATEVAEAMRDMLAAGLSVETTFAKIVPALERAKRESISIDEFIETEGLKDELREVRDLTEELNQARLGTFKGQLSQLGSAMGELSIAVANAGLLEFARDVTQGFTALVDGLSKTDPALLSTMTAGLGLLAVIGPSMAAAGSLIWGVGQFFIGIGKLIGVLSGPVGLTAALALATIAGASWLATFNSSYELQNNLRDATNGATAAIDAHRAAIDALRNAREEDKPAAEAQVARTRAQVKASLDEAQAVLAVARAQAAAADAKVRNSLGRDSTIQLQANSNDRIDAAQALVDRLTATLGGDGWDSSVAMLGEIESRLGKARSSNSPGVEKLEDLHSKVVQLLEAVDDPLKLTSAEARNLSEEINALAESFGISAQSVQASADGMAAGVVQSMTTGMEPAVAAGLSAALQISEAWKQTYIDVVGNSYVPDMVDEVGEHMARLDEVAVAPAQAAAGAISGIFAGLQASVGLSMGEIGNIIGGGLKGALNALPFGNAPNSADLLRNIGGNVQRGMWGSLVDSAFGGIGDMFQGWAGATKGKGGWTPKVGGSMWDTALSWIGNLFGGGRANGGSTYPGRIYEVGEFGREMFVPKEPGNILNSRQLAALGGGGGHFIDARTIINGNVDSVTMPVLQQALDANNRMWASRFAAGVNATLQDNRRQQRRI